MRPSRGSQTLVRKSWIWLWSPSAVSNKPRPPGTRAPLFWTILSLRVGLTRNRQNLRPGLLRGNFAPWNKQPHRKKRNTFRGSSLKAPIWAPRLNAWSKQSCPILITRSIKPNFVSLGLVLRHRQCQKSVVKRSIWSSMFPKRTGT
jgi:hypothetical protein